MRTLPAAQRAYHMDDQRICYTVQRGHDNVVSLLVQQDLLHIQKHNVQPLSGQPLECGVVVHIDGRPPARDEITHDIVQQLIHHNSQRRVVELDLLCRLEAFTKLIKRLFLCCMANEPSFFPPLTCSKACSLYDRCLSKCE